MRIKARDIPRVRQEFLDAQGNCCAICGSSFSEATYNRSKRKTELKFTPVLDHDHKTGAIRGVLCRGCNTIEGKLLGLFQRWNSQNVPSIPKVLRGMAGYYEWYSYNQTGLIHPDHKTEDEKRLVRNAKQRKARALAKARRNLN